MDAGLRTDPTAELLVQLVQRLARAHTVRVQPVGFVDKYGITDAYELESMNPSDLAEKLESAIEDVLDIDLYNQELAAEEADSMKIFAVQQQTEQFFKSLNLE